MKTIMKKGFLFIICFLTFVFYQCEKTDNKVNEVIDYRDKFCGDFSFSVIDWVYCINSPRSENTTRYLGKIVKVTNSDSQVLISYKNGRNGRICSGDSLYGSYIIPKIDSIGKLDYKIKCAANSGFTGYFADNDTVKIYITGGGMGCNSGQKIIGIKQ